MNKKGIFIRLSVRMLAIILSFGLVFPVLAISSPVVYAEDESQLTQESQSADGLQLTETSTALDSDQPEIVQVDGVDCIDGQVIVKFDDNISNSMMMSILDDMDSELEAELPVDDLVLTEVPEGETVENFVEAMEDLPTVEYVQPNYIYKLDDMSYKYYADQNHSEQYYTTEASVNDPYTGDQWYLNTIDAYNAWDYTMGSSDVRVAVIDTGIDLDNPEFAGKIYAQTDTTDEGGDAEDDDGHGSHVAGIIAANANDGVGVAGVAPGVDLIAVDVFTWYGSDFGASTTDIVEGINYAQSQGADVINLSLGNYYYDAAYEEVISDVVSNGIIVVCAAGNDSTSEPHYPSDYSAAVGVIATDWNDNLASYSNYGSAKDISAPGGDDDDMPDSLILSTYKDGAYYYMGGTSMAAPVVSGVAALALSKNPSLTVSELKDILYDTSVDLGDEGKDDIFGYGRIDAYEAVLAAYNAISDVEVDIVAEANNSAYGTATGGGTYDSGESVTLQAIPNSRYRFVCWENGSIQVSTNATYTFNASKDTTYTAEFVKIGIPTVTAASSGYNSVKLTWNKISGASGYEVYRATSSSGTYARIFTATSGGSLSYNNTGLTTGKTYYYKVRAYCISGGTTTYGDFSSIKSVKPTPSKPTLKASSSGYNRVKLTWNKIPGASGYNVYRATSSGGKYTRVYTATSGSKLSYTNTGLATGKTYYYKVRAYRIVNGIKVYGSSSYYKSAKPTPSKPTLKASSSGYNRVKLTWNKISGASGYNVYRATSKYGKYTRVYTAASGSKLSYTNTRQTTGKTYYYKVRAYRIVNGTKVYGSSSYFKAAKPIPSKPIVKLTYAGYRKVKVSWNKISGASGYKVYRATSKYGKYTRVYTATSGSKLSYTNTGLTKGKTYYYKVRAYRTVNGTKVYGSYSSIKSYRP